ncbi:MAG: DUF4349 domain-containing protein [Candidatus Gottesmanbacteria bacterium]
MLDWVKRNKIAALIILVLLVLLIKSNLSSVVPLIPTTGVLRSDMMEQKMAVPGSFGTSSIMPPSDQYTPTQTQNRLVVQESSMSMLVSNVRKINDQIVDKAKSVGGYMVNTSLTNPQEAPFATVTIRIPADELKTTLDYFRTLAIKVTSENILGTDVTDQYVDVQARLATLEKTKAKFADIMDKAVQVQDILTVQRELINIQDQIDSLKGQQQYLEQTAKLAKVTVSLSTDEFALPYAPTGQFRPEVIFKQAVRSMVTNIRDLAGVLIWVVVYGVIWIPLAVIVFLVWRKRNKKVVQSS